MGRARVGSGSGAGRTHIRVGIGLRSLPGGDGHGMDVGPGAGDRPRGAALTVWRGESARSSVKRPAGARYALASRQPAARPRTNPLAATHRIPGPARHLHLGAALAAADHARTRARSTFEHGNPIRRARLCNGLGANRPGSTERRGSNRGRGDSLGSIPRHAADKRARPLDIGTPGFPTRVPAHGPAGADAQSHLPRSLQHCAS